MPKMKGGAIYRGGIKSIIRGGCARARGKKCVYTFKA